MVLFSVLHPFSCFCCSCFYLGKREVWKDHPELLSSACSNHCSKVQQYTNGLKNTWQCKKWAQRPKHKIFQKEQGWVTLQLLWDSSSSFSLYCQLNKEHNQKLFRKPVPLMAVTCYLSTAAHHCSRQKDGCPAICHFPVSDFLSEKLFAPSRDTKSSSYWDDGAEGEREERLAKVYWVILV